MKKELDKNSFPTPTITVEHAISAGILMPYLEREGWTDFNLPKWAEYQWTRKHCRLDDLNYMTYADLSEKALEQFRQYFSSNAMPGTSSNVVVPVEGYNTFAKWDKWKGGYVANLGYVSAPSSSEAYGASSYLNSWIPQGGPDTPLPEVKFYKLQESKQWRGGHVSDWGYVAKDRHVLGASTSIWFNQTYQASELPLVNLVNLNILLYSNTIDLSVLKKTFEDCWNKSTNSYEIDDQRLRQYLGSKYLQGSFTNLPDALEKHYGVILRIVTRTDSATGRKYGDDYLVIAYNPLLRTYMYFNAVTGKLGTLDAAPLLSGAVESVVFAYYR